MVLAPWAGSEDMRFGGPTQFWGQLPGSALGCLSPHATWLVRRSSALEQRLGGSSTPFLSPRPGASCHPFKGHRPLAWRSPNLVGLSQLQEGPSATLRQELGPSVLVTGHCPPWVLSGGLRLGVGVQPSRPYPHVWEVEESA